jgi:hypothetical protein
MGCLRVDFLLMTNNLKESFFPKIQRSLSSGIGDLERSLVLNQVLDNHFLIIDTGQMERRISLVVGNLDISVHF